SRHRQLGLRPLLDIWLGLCCCPDSGLSGVTPNSPQSSSNRRQGYGHRGARFGMAGRGGTRSCCHSGNLYLEEREEPTSRASYTGSEFQRGQVSRRSVSTSVGSRGGHSLSFVRYHTGSL